MYKKLETDPSKINNIYSLLTVFLVTAEGLLGFWFFKAQESQERMIIGTLMTIIFLCFLFLIFKLAKEKTFVNNVPNVLDGPITPANKEVTIAEIKIIGAEQMSGPEGTFTIDAPPPQWMSKVVSLNTLISENLDIHDLNLDPQSPNNRNNILLCSSNIIAELIPIPGKTSINGTIFPTALITKTPIQFTVIPFERLQPPFYVENSFEHNVFNYVGQVLKATLTQMQSYKAGKIPESGREFIQIEIIQELEHVDLLINEHTINDCSKIKINITIIAIKGDIIDHILVMNYPSSEDKAINGFLENDFTILKSLVNSFKPLKIQNPVKLINEIKERGKVNYENVLKENGVNMFGTEFNLVIRKLKNINPKNTKEKDKIIRMLKPFREYYKLIGEKEDLFEEFWTALAEAEKGNFENLLQQINEFIEDFDDMDKDLSEGDNDLQIDTSHPPVT